MVHLNYSVGLMVDTEQPIIVQHMARFYRLLELLLNMSLADHGEIEKLKQEDD